MQIAKKMIRWLTTNLAQKNYYLAKANFFYMKNRSIVKSQRPPVLVYQMGKVGSSTVVKSLMGLKLNMPVFHPHFLTQDFISLYEKKRRKYFGTDQYGDLKHIWECQFLSEKIKRGVRGKRWKVITLVRDPVIRNISAFFETLEVTPTETDGKFRVKAEKRSTYEFDITVSLGNVQDLISLFLEEFDHETPLVFFDNQLKAVFSIDVFASDFSTMKGYAIYVGDRADVLLIRLENLTECGETAIKEFLDIDQFNLVDTNVSREKIYFPFYKQLVEEIVLPERYLEEMYSSRYARHFYTEDEIRKFKMRWQRGRQGSSS